MIGDPLVLSNTCSKTNDRSYALTNIYVTEKQGIFLAAKTFQLLASNVMNLISTDFNLFLVIPNFTWKLRERLPFYRLKENIYVKLKLEERRKFTSLIIFLTF